MRNDYIEKQIKYRAARANARDMKRKKSRRRNIVFYIIIAVCAAVFIFAAVKVIGILTGYAKADGVYDSVADEVISIDDSAAADDDEEGTSKRLLFDFDLLKARCEYAVGYIYQEDILSYPIVQYTDNDYFLTHLVDGTYSANGSIFVDCNNKGGLDDQNSIVYGHNMLNGSMFGNLSRYTSYSYFEKYPEMDVFIGYDHYKYKVFSAYTADVSSITYQTDFSSDDEFINFLNYVKAQSLYDTGISDFGADSRVIVLSTCTANSATKYRFVVILIRDRLITD